MGWQRPSQRVCELIQQGAGLVVSSSPQWLDRLHEATLTSEYVQAIADDPVLVEAIRRSNRSNLLHWAAANISHPGEPVPANLGVETLAIVREGMRRGLDETALVDGYRIAQGVAWRAWMNTALVLTSDRHELAELLDVSARSITSFIDATVAGIYQQMRIERDELAHGSHRERGEIVTLILDGAPIARQHAEAKLGYRLNQSHTAAVIWGDESNTNLADLDRAAAALMHREDTRRPLSMQAGTATRWVWLPGDDPLDVAAVGAAAGQLPGVRIAIGPTVAGIEGFRTSHLDAITTQRMMARLGSTRQVANFADVELVTLITAEPERTNRFITRTLGDLESADVELRQAVLAFIRERYNSSAAAERLFVHRNTLLRRLARADKLLPRPLGNTGLHVGAALEALSWRGTGC